MFKNRELCHRHLKQLTRQKKMPAIVWDVKKCAKFLGRFLNGRFDLENPNKDCNLEINTDKLAWNWEVLIKITEDKFQRKFV